jgi:hypothetical protein
MTASEDSQPGRAKQFPVRDPKLRRILDRIHDGAKAGRHLARREGRALTCARLDDAAASSASVKTVCFRESRCAMAHRSFERRKTFETCWISLFVQFGGISRQQCIQSNN